ncbi:MAG: glycoside hydrolase [Micavibrio aeruginosavorus]|uniref:Glycoside hydrolase n=1 Tax=Micavibrio aeruginosavorus TaxID=349221 RepID=A0A2W5FKT6_9BACT|nr:MAG: glycoside hydrolase [Micavibrio aeruginosavorus]
MKKNYLCIHSHFYQPPRENPWLEAIDYQESASPYHDWNERINAECYNPNGQSRILDDQGRVIRLTNNYTRMSFNFGPTLLSWMEENDPIGYNAILEGDRLSRERFEGHGSAIAQAYNHIILPLANRRDKETQVIWGLLDFEKRFGRKAEAMWLPETAVDLETLEILANHGMKFVILAPRQADAVRNIGQDNWHSVIGDKIDTRHPYQIRLPNGKTISAFFYDGTLSQAVAFEGLLNNGEIFARRLMDSFDERTEPQILHIATDGESYGHHHRHGDMALAYAFDYIEKSGQVELVNYSLYLEKFPPKCEVRIHENSSWSCIHGIERWRSDCGCNGGMGYHWNQKWRKPLREAMDFLHDQLEIPYEDFMSVYTDDPWGMRDNYIHIILDRSENYRSEFFNKWLKPGINSADVGQNILKALELQRNLLLIFTSCAWFFDEISGTEAVQDLQYAARAIELAKEIFDIDLGDQFTAILKEAPSNLPEFYNGKYVYENLAVPAHVDFLKLSAHLAATTLFKDKIKDGHLYCFDFHWNNIERFYSGKAQVVCAHVTLKSRITLEQQEVEFAIIHLGDHNINVGALPYSGKEAYSIMVKDFSEAFKHGYIANALRILDKYFEGNLYSLNDLFRDQRKEIIDIVFSQTLSGVEDQLKNIYQQYYSVMRYLSNIHVALPPVFSHIARFVQSRDIECELANEEINISELNRHIHEAKQYGVELDALRIETDYLQALQRLFNKFKQTENEDSLKQFSELLETVTQLPFSIDLGDIQSAFAIWAFDQKRNLQAAFPNTYSLIEKSALNLSVRIQSETQHE